MFYWNSLAFLMIQQMLAIWSLVSLSFLKSAWVDHKEGWTPRNWCFQIVVLEKTLESPLDSKEIKPVNPKENQPEYSPERLMLKLKLQYFGHLMQSQLTGKYFDAGKDWGQEDNGTTEDKMVRWHHWHKEQEDMSLSKLWGILKHREAWFAAVRGVTKS